MPCTPVTLPGGQRAIVCGPRRARPRCACGAPAPFLCDWKVEGGTCSKTICARCSTKPAPDKDLCPVHAEAWRTWIEQRRRSDSP